VKPDYKALGLKKAEDLVFACYKLVPAHSGAIPFILEPITEPPTWHKQSSYRNGDLVVPSDPNNAHYYQASIARADGKEAEAKSGHTEPTWNGDTTDNGIIWKEAGELRGQKELKVRCTNITPTNPLVMDRILVVALDMSDIPPETKERFKILNLNITNQQGAPLNVTPVRSSVAAGSATGAAVSLLAEKEKPPAPKAYFMTWPNQMPGDTAVTASVNLVYTPVAPGLPWTPNTFYPAGTIVMPNDTIGHYYIAVNSGYSADKQEFEPHYELKPLSRGTGLSWKDRGLIPALNPPVTTTWKANTAYADKALVQPEPANHHYYEAVGPGATGQNPPPFPVHYGDQVVESEHIELLDAGATQPANSKLRAWAENAVYFLADVILDPKTQHYWLVTQPGYSGKEKQLKAEVPAPVWVLGDAIASSTKPAVTWQDIGAGLPSSATLGVPASDPTVNLLNYTFAQVHTLSRFNLTAGLVASTIRARSFTCLGSSYQVGSTSYYNWNTIKNNITVDPVVALMVYLKPMDAERKFHRGDLTPALTMGLSMASPTKNFYFGGSSELFVRNLQLMYGITLAQGSELQPITFQTSSSTPVTRQVLLKGGFIGISFNVSGFITSLTR
jgi:hypothetical protein